MKASYLIFFLSLKLLLVFIDPRVNGDSRRRNLHQPLDPTTFASPPSPPPPPLPDSAKSDQPTPAPSNVSLLPNLPSSTQQSFKPIKTLGIVCSVAIVTLGMLSALAFFLYRQRIKYKCKSRMLVEKERSLSFRPDSEIPRSCFLNFGTMERTPCSIVGPNGQNGEVESPPQPRVYSRLLSPELQPLPPLSQHQIEYPSFEIPLSDDDSRETIFHTPEWSAAVSYGGGIFPRTKKEAHYKSPIVQAKGTSPLPYPEDSLIKQDLRRPAASPPPPPTTPL